jgi:hypothetical protein
MRYNIKYNAENDELSRNVIKNTVYILSKKSLATTTTTFFILICFSSHIASINIMDITWLINTKDI